MDQESLLQLWLKTYPQKLSPEHRQRFLTSEESRVICLYDDADIRAAIKNGPKLKAILQSLRDFYGDLGGGYTPRPRKPSPSGPNGSGTSSSEPTRTRTGRSRSRTSVWDPPAPYGTTDPRYK
jgi:hypothetical protein